LRDSLRASKMQSIYFGARLKSLKMLSASVCNVQKVSLGQMAQNFAGNDPSWSTKESESIFCSTFFLKNTIEIRLQFFWWRELFS